MWAAVHAGCGTPVHEGGWGTRTPCRCQSSQSCFEPRGAATSADSHRTKSLCWSAWWENQIWETIPSSQQTFRRVTMRKQMCALVLTLFSFVYICQHTGRAPHRWRHQLHLHFLQYCTKMKTVYYFFDLSFCSLFQLEIKTTFSSRIFDDVCLAYSTLRATRCVKSPTVSVEKMFPDKFLFAGRKKKTIKQELRLQNFVEHDSVHVKHLFQCRLCRLSTKQHNTCFQFGDYSQFW